MRGLIRCRLEPRLGTASPSLSSPDDEPCPPPREPSRYRLFRWLLWRRRYEPLCRLRPDLRRCSIRSSLSSSAMRCPPSGTTTTERSLLFSQNAVTLRVVWLPTYARCATSGRNPSPLTAVVVVITITIAWLTKAPSTALLLLLSSITRMANVPITTRNVARCTSSRLRTCSRPQV